MNIADLPYETALPARFWDKVDESGPIPAHAPELGHCWVWSAYTTKAGYGQFWFGASRKEPRQLLAHRLSIFDAGAMHDGRLDVDHKCHNRACVNPGHLRMLTRAMNIQNRKGPRRGSHSELPGVTFDKRRGTFAAELMAQGVRRRKSGFALAEDAFQVAQEWRRELMPHSTLCKEGGA